MARRYLLIIAAALVVSGCDQVTKYQAVAALTDGLHGANTWSEKLSAFISLDHPARTGRVQVIDGYWEHVYVENLGASFSTFSTWPRWIARPLLLLVPLLAMFGLGWFVHHHPGRWTSTGAALVLGGAIGNFADRVRMGYVIDFVHWHLGDSFSWPVFNIADVAIFLGALALFWGARAAAEPEESGDPPAAAA